MAAVRDVVISDQDFAQIKAALKDQSTQAYWDRGDGKLILYVDDGTGTKLDTIHLKPQSTLG